MPAVPKRSGINIPPPGSSKARTGTPSGESSIPRSSSPSARETRRTAQPEKLKVQVERFYVMMGVILIPLGRFIPQFKPLGEGLKEEAENISEAWIDLAEEDKRVKEFLKSITGASTWGNVIGAHFVVAMKVMSVGGENIMSQIPDMKQAEEDPIAFAKKMGLSDEQIKEAVKMAEGVVSDRPPEPTPENVRTQREQITDEISNLKAGMATPEQMGVVNDGQQQWSGPMNTGGQRK